MTAAIPTTSWDVPGAASRIGAAQPQMMFTAAIHLAFEPCCQIFNRTPHALRVSVWYQLCVSGSPPEEGQAIHNYRPCTPSELVFQVRPSGFEPETCGLRVGSRRVGGVHPSL
jgi:hypothetical protein